MNSFHIRQRAKALRLEMTEYERLVWHHLRLRKMGFKFRRQAPIGSFVVDFVCYEKKLVIELDGAPHQEQEAYDEARSEWLRSQGFHVVRFWNREVLYDLEGVLETIRLILMAPSPLVGEGRDRGQ